MILWSQVFGRQNTQGTPLHLHVVPQVLCAPPYRPQKGADLGRPRLPPTAALGSEGLVPAGGPLPRGMGVCEGRSAAARIEYLTQRPGNLGSSPGPVAVLPKGGPCTSSPKVGLRLPPLHEQFPPDPPLPTRERINRRGDNGFKKYTHPTVTVPGTQAISFVPGQPSLTNPRFSLGPLLTQPEIIPVFSNCPDLIKCRRQAGWCLRGSVRDRQGHRSRSAGTRLWSRDCTPHPAAFRPLRPGGPRPTPALRASGSSRGRLPPGKVAAFPREGRASASG